MRQMSTFSSLADRELISTVRRLAADERHATVSLIASLAELDARRLYLGEGCSSMFTYCTQVLHLSEHAAYGRIEAARLARRFPIILDQLADGAITLTAIGLLAPHLTTGNHRELLESARHKSKRDLEHLVAMLRPQPSVQASVRKLPSPAAAPRPAAPQTALLDETAEPDMALRGRKPYRSHHVICQRQGRVRQPPGGQLSGRLPPNATRCSSRWMATALRSCAGPRR